MPQTELSPIARALGRVPTGLYVVTTRNGGMPMGFVGSFVVQTGFEPPTVCVAIARGRDHLEAIRQTGSFAVSVLDDKSRPAMGAFFKKRPAGGSAFDDVETFAAPSGCPVLANALAWLDCRLSGEQGTGDHVVVFGEVTAGDLLRAGDPAIHLRENGLDY